MKIDLLSAIVKVSVGVGTSLTALAFTPDISAPYIGVPLNVVVACAAGAFSSFSFGDKVSPRSRMFQLFFTCVFMGCAWTAVVNGILAFWFEGFKISPGFQAGMGAIISCLSRFFIPAIIERIGPWLDKIPFLRKSEKGE